MWCFFSSSFPVPSQGMSYYYYSLYISYLSTSPVGQVSRTKKKAQIAHHHFLIAQIFHYISTCTDTNCEYSPKQTNNKVKHLKFVKQLSTVLILCLFWRLMQFTVVICYLIPYFMSKIIAFTVLVLFGLHLCLWWQSTFTSRSHSVTHCLEGHCILKSEAEIV